MSNVKYIIYVRKSSDREDHQILSIDSQIRELEKLASVRNLQVIDVYKEEKTAYKTGRPMFNEMLERIERGEADGIIVFHLTRIARNSSDGGRVIYMMDEGVLKEIVTPESNYLNIPDHKFLMQIHFAMAKKSSDDTSTFVKRDNQSKLDKGEIIGLASFGLLNIDREGRIVGKRYDNLKQSLLAQLNRPLKRLEIDPIDGPLLRKVFEKAATDQYAVKELTKFGQDIGLRQLTNHALHNIFHNPIYYGFIKCKGSLYKGDFEPLISKNTFDMVQRNLTLKSKKRKAKHNFTFTGLIRCAECGSMITAETQKEHVYYRCSKKRGKCTQRYLRQEILEQQMAEHLKKVQIPKAFTDWALKQLQLGYKTEASLQEKTRLRQQLEINRLKKMREKLTESYLSSDTFSKEEYLEQKKRIEEALLMLEEKSSNQNSSEIKWINDCEQFFDFSKQLLSKFENGGAEEKRIILQSIGSNFLLKDRKLSLQYQKLYQPFFKLNQFEVETSKSRLEPKKSLATAKNSNSSQKLHLWGELRDSNP